MYVHTRAWTGNRSLPYPLVTVKDGSMSGVYANIVVDIQAKELKDRLFTYKVPEELLQDTFIGAQVLVPFGAGNTVGGYVISLTDQPSRQSGMKEIVDVLEPEPLFDREYIDFLYWIAEYYCASISDVIAAAIPSFFSPKIKRTVKLSKAAPELGLQTSNSGDPAAYHLLSVLQGSKTGALTVVALRQRWRKAAKLPQSHFYRALNSLRQLELLSIENETRETQTAKTQNIVIWTGAEPGSARQKEIIAVLSRHGGQLPLKDLLEQSHASSTTIKKLASDKIVLISQEEVIRDPLKHTEAVAEVIPALTDDQDKALTTLSEELQSKLALKEPAGIPVEPWLLHGVTGSGKTEIYLRLIDQALRQKKTSLLLVPEISLTPQLAKRLKSRFGEKVSVWHSALSDGERYDTWRRLRAGDVRILLGARSAVLANMPDLGLIILDEEHDGSYKQSSPSPRYNARDVAIEKATRSGAMLVLGSATPDVGTYFHASKTQRILELPQRVFKQAMPVVKMVDMREEFSNGNRSIFSYVLTSQLAQCFKQNEQAILLINRRGYASHVFCRACGHVVTCKNCSVSLVFHQSRSSSGQTPLQAYLSGHLSCHHCGFSTAAFETCPACRSPFIRQFGLGTQRIEEEVRDKFSDARILRLDSDVTTRKGAHEEILQQFAKGEADVLIGTQMVAKGLDIANVTLVGVLAADASFNLPDYRSVERGFQLLTQVSGRAGRGDKTGIVVMQSFNLEMPALQWSKDHNYASFYEEEILARREFGYPPFSQLMRIVVAGPDTFMVEQACEQLAEEMGNFLADLFSIDEISVLGPAPCLIERLRGKYRYHLLIKNMAGDRGRQVLTQFLRSRRLATGLTMAVDVDALDLV